MNRGDLDLEEMGGRRGKHSQSKGTLNFMQEIRIQVCLVCFGWEMEMKIVGSEKQALRGWLGPRKNEMVQKEGLTEGVQRWE